MNTTIQHNHNNKKNFSPTTKELLYRLILPSPKQLSRLEFGEHVKCLADISNMYIKIDSTIFFVKRINSFGDACLCEVNDNGSIENIATIKPAGKAIELSFRYKGLRVSTKVKLSDILKTDGARYE